MTALEAYELTTRGGATDFHRLIDVCESFGLYCLIGDFAVNCYVEPPVYTLDSDLIVTASNLSKLTAHFKAPESDLRIPFTTDERYQAFPARATEAEVLGVRVKVACLEDLTRAASTLNFPQSPWAS